MRRLLFFFRISARAWESSAGYLNEPHTCGWGERSTRYDHLATRFCTRVCKVGST